LLFLLLFRWKQFFHHQIIQLRVVILGSKVQETSVDATAMHDLEVISHSFASSVMMPNMAIAWYSLRFHNTSLFSKLKQLAKKAYIVEQRK
jgi:hypothetical protein